MPEQDAAALLAHAIERRSRATRALVDGTIDDATTTEFVLARLEEATALGALGGAGISPHSANRSRRA